MSKKVEKTTVVSEIDVMSADLNTLNHEQFVIRYQANQARVKVLQEENRLISTLDKGARAKEKASNATAKIEALQAKLAALSGSVEIPEVPSTDTVAVNQ